MERNATPTRCITCGLSTDPNKPDFAHTRLGLDEAPEPLLCKCKPDHEVMESIMIKYATMHRFMNTGTKMITNKIMNADINTCVIRGVSPFATMELEMRLNPYASRLMFEKMSSGMFGSAKADRISESGCSWWTGTASNAIAKLRVRSNGDVSAKIVISTCEIMPGYKFAISNEYGFVGEVVRPEYATNMNELSITTRISNTPVKLISRQYVCEDTVSYSSEIEFERGVTHLQIRLVMGVILNVVGTETSIARYVDTVFMDEIRNADHDVVDVKSLAPYRGSIMVKADGMKCYVFCYPNGYVVTFANRELTVVNYTIEPAYMPLISITNKPDVLVAELMANGELVYIDTLSVNGEVVPISRLYISRPVTMCKTPIFMMRKIWDRICDVPKNPISGIDSDGIVCVTEFRTLRLKKPTIDLLHTNGSLYMRENGASIMIATGHPDMVENSIYELSVTKGTIPNTVVLASPVRRLIKRVPNNSDIVRRAFMSVFDDVTMNTIVYDITSMSFAMRSRVYEMAQSCVSTRRKVIVVFGAGRLQEIYQMKLGDFSYIVVDPNIDFSIVTKRMRRFRISPYDVTASMNKQAIMIGNTSRSMLYYRGTSESFIRSRDVITTMAEMGIPAVFSFSISYHVGVINTLRNSGVTTIGCGFVHDNMPRLGVGFPPVTMNLVRDENGFPVVRSVFGKSVWIEPILLTNSVTGLISIEKAIPDVWRNVDSSTTQIMSRAVIMY